MFQFSILVDTCGLNTLVRSVCNQKPRRSPISCVEQLDQLPVLCYSARPCGFDATGGIHQSFGAKVVAPLSSATWKLTDSVPWLTG